VSLAAGAVLARDLTHSCAAAMESVGIPLRESLWAVLAATPRPLESSRVVISGKIVNRTSGGPVRVRPKSAGGSHLEEPTVCLPPERLAAKRVPKFLQKGFCVLI